MNILRIKFKNDTKLLDAFNINQDRVILQRESRGAGNGQSLWPDSAIQICEEGFYVPADNNGKPLKVQPKAAYVWSVNNNKISSEVIINFNISPNDARY